MRSCGPMRRRGARRRAQTRARRRSSIIRWQRLRSHWMRARHRLLPSYRRCRFRSEALPRCAAAASDTSEAARAAAETAAAAADGAAFIPKADTSAFAEAAEAASTSSASGCAGLSSALLAKVLQREAAEKQKQAEAPVIDLAAQLRGCLLADSMRSIYHEENKRIAGGEALCEAAAEPAMLTSQDELSSQMKLSPESCRTGARSSA